MVPRGTMERTPHRHKHTNGDANVRQEEEVSVGKAEEDAHQEYEGNARGERDANDRQEEEVDVWEKRGDADQECEGDAGGERHTNHKQNEEADAFVETGDTGQECMEDTGGDSRIDKLHSSRIQDPETCHIPGGTWLAQVRAQLQGSTSALLKRRKRKWGGTEKEKENSHS
ncbi:hypothetical protein NDU88_004129 [Pleurodeles waltl]|uniref:Uncharacterized protein n=1 Tax=Pleurodeles waltl TaxID=8319 RepID=A0AAV7WR04_PLEWA|nr:hypothetical protein NDU88_004129 [Pleurodeles waltl]